MTSRLKSLTLLALLLGLLGPLLDQSSVAWAHPLDEYLQVGYIALEPERITLELDLTPGALVAPQVIALIDTDGDGALSEAEGVAYAQSVLQEVSISLDGRTLSPTLISSQLPVLLHLNAGAGTIRLEASAATGDIASGGHQLVIQNGHEPVKRASQITALLPKADGLTIVQQARDASQHSLQIDYTLVTSPLASEASAASAVTTSNTQQQQLIDTLAVPTPTLPLVVLAFSTAIVLGGLHALTPGHGKTLVAAYLVGSRGTARHAVLLGSVTTFTHTISVVAVGMLALVAQQFIAPGLLVSLLEVGSGVLVVLMGLRLVLVRVQSLRADDASHDHGFGPHTHAPGGSTHAHAGMSRIGILTMGVSGGLVPCPEALGIMLVAIGLNRAGLGLGLVIAFSLGLAAVLIALGIVLVRSKSLIERIGGRDARWQRYQRWLPLASAIVITALVSAWY